MEHSEQQGTEPVQMYYNPATTLAVCAVLLIASSVFLTGTVGPSLVTSLLDIAGFVFVVFAIRYRFFA